MSQLWKTLFFWHNIYIMERVPTCLFEHFTMTFSISACMQSPSDWILSDNGLLYLVVMAMVAESTPGLSTDSNCDDACIVYTEHCCSFTDHGNFSPMK